MAKEKEMVHNPIRKSRIDECANYSKMDDHSARKLLAKHSEVDVGRGQALPSRDLVAQLGNLVGVLDLELDPLIRGVVTSDIRIECIQTRLTHNIPKTNSRR